MKKHVSCRVHSTGSSLPTPTHRFTRTTFFLFTRLSTWNSSKIPTKEKAQFGVVGSTWLRFRNMSARAGPGRCCALMAVLEVFRTRLLRQIILPLRSAVGGAVFEGKRSYLERGAFEMDGLCCSFIPKKGCSCENVTLSAKFE